MNDQTWVLGGGSVVIEGATGAPVQFSRASDPDRPFLLDARIDAWHHPDHAWGSGFAIIEGVAVRWNRPDVLERVPDGLRAEYVLAETCRLMVTRRVIGECLRETFELRNDGSRAIDVSTVGVSTPFRDVYEADGGALARGNHVHVWTGGSDSWVLARPMSGADDVLALTLTRGRLTAYSVESRNINTVSNVRGHLVLHPTDAGRNPRAMGGQRVLSVPPGQAEVWEWEVGFPESAAHFESARSHPLYGVELAASIPGRVTLPVALDAVRADPAVRVGGRDGAVELSGASHGVFAVDVAGMQTSVLFHLPVRELVERRVAYILRHQRAVERAGSGAGALVPVDTRTGLRQSTNGWSDWSDGAERMAMPALLQQALLRGWGDREELLHAVTAWIDFATADLLDTDATVRWGSGIVEAHPRLYNFPWLVHILCDQARITGDQGLLDLALRVQRRAVELGATRHLAIGFAEALSALAGSLDAVGRTPDADEMRGVILSAADHFGRVGGALPGHEVNFEHAMIAPLVSLLAVARTLRHDDRDRRALESAVRWLRAFGGPQPHPRLRSIALRHWDGFWFGLRRQWGDVFPHHWSALTASALDLLEEDLRDESIEAEIDRIFVANLANIREDGSATCAFVFPSTVDGEPAYAEDPLANDQDWALVLLLRSGREME
ncbi:hypothetical protein [Microbacterium sp. RURRCA19A]|uniref:hypothetical protein n=1 Tax=Microbacterium sp. RURRCA19A TaxID=1907391 RepID=UPI0009553B81|nr:hypothetical protein [Microbacterium sp. RURRCA19A]SIS11096.1 hypothetical protein SAMN05880568_2844 [Microbacterium sp. RURRCA19A]